MFKCWDTPWFRVSISGLIRKEDAWTNSYPPRRTKAVYMTTKGQVLMNKLYAHMG